MSKLEELASLVEQNADFNRVRTAVDLAWIAYRRAEREHAEKRAKGLGPSSDLATARRELAEAERAFTALLVRAGVLRP